MEQGDIIRQVLRESVVGNADEHQGEYEEHYDQGITNPNLITWKYAWDNYPYLRIRMSELKQQMIDEIKDWYEDDDIEQYAEIMAMEYI